MLTRVGPLRLRSVIDLKGRILQIAALSDRGQRLNTLVAPVYQELRTEMKNAADKLCAMSFTVNEKALAGEWELVYSDVELFRSSPFFLAIEQALDTSPGIPALGKWLGITDPTKKSAMFFKLHQLQVLSWGASTVGRISQTIDFEKKEFVSSFDTLLFGLTVIPILGWFKLLPTFGGRVVTVLMHDLHSAARAAQTTHAQTYQIRRVRTYACKKVCADRETYARTRSWQTRWS